MNSHAFHEQLTAQRSCTGSIRFARACFLPNFLPKRGGGINCSNTFWGYLLFNMMFSNVFYLPPPHSLKTLSSSLKTLSWKGYPKNVPSPLG